MIFWRINGGNVVCHIETEGNMDLRPKMQNNKDGLCPASIASEWEKLSRILRVFHDGVYNGRCKPQRSHDWSQSNEDVDFVVKPRMYTECRKSLSGALTKSHIAQLFYSSELEDEVQGIRNVTLRKIVNREILVKQQKSE